MEAWKQRPTLYHARRLNLPALTITLFYLRVTAQRLVMRVREQLT